MRTPIIFGFCLGTLLPALHSQSEPASDLTVTFSHRIAGAISPGAIRIDIDTAASAGPFDIFLQGPAGLRDTVRAWPKHTFLYQNMPAGAYEIRVLCCATCEARLSGEIKIYEALPGSGDTILLLAREKSPPLGDSGAILLAFSGIETGAAGDTATFSLYAPSGFRLPDPGTTLRTALRAISLLKETGHWKPLDPATFEYDAPGFFPDNYRDAWVEQPFVALVRLNEAGAIEWVAME